MVLTILFRKTKNYVFSFLVLVSLFFFIKNSSGYKSWQKLSPENQKLSLKLELDRYYYSLFPPTIKNSSFIPSDSIRYAIKIGTDWLIRLQEESGKFKYWYNPATGKFSANEDNFLRQALGAYALTQSFEITKDSSLLSSAQRSLMYLETFRKDLSTDTSYYLYNGTAKLGGIALPMLVMLKIKEYTREKINDKKLISLANMILYQQKVYKTGQYKSIYSPNINEKTDRWESQIYPGEAMLALSEMYRHFKDERYHKSISWAYDYYSKEKRWKNYTFLPWSISAFTSIYSQTKIQKYADFVFEMTDYMLSRQNLNSNRIVYGSFENIPTVFTATALEGLGEAIRLAKFLQNHEKVEFYSKRAKIGYKWLLKLQYSDGEVDQNARGGFRTSLVEPEIRIDNNQHSISALVKGLKYVY